MNPNKAVADYRSEITGVTAEDLVGVTCSLADIQVNFVVFFSPGFQGYSLQFFVWNYYCFFQRRMEKLLSHGNILVGHSLNNDLNGKLSSITDIWVCLGDIETVLGFRWDHGAI